MNKTLFLGVFFLFPSVSFASIAITEIMYDLSGGDTGREWIEIQNTGGSSIEFENYRLFEANINHSLSLFQGSGSLSSGEVGIIADDGVKFKIDFPSFTGKIYESSFSLSNTSETLTIRDDALTDIVSVTYMTSHGGAGDGNSLHIQGSSITAGSPSPGTVGNTSQTSQTQTQAVQTHTQTTEVTGGSTNDSALFAIRIEGKQKVYTQEEASFIAHTRAYGNEGVMRGKFIWNFGDGRTLEAIDENKAFHTYIREGTYVVHVSHFYNPYQGEPSSTAEFVVSVEKAQIEMSATPLTISFHNKGTLRHDLGVYILKGEYGEYRFPKNTILLPGGSLTFERSVAGEIGEGLSLVAQNGSVIASVSKEIKITPFSTPDFVQTKSVSLGETQEEISPQIEEESSGENTSSLSANVLDGGNTLFENPFLVSLLGVLILAIIGVMFVREERKNPSYTIIEHKDE